MAKKELLTMTKVGLTARAAGYASSLDKGVSTYTKAGDIVILDADNAFHINGKPATIEDAYEHFRAQV